MILQQSILTFQEIIDQYPSEWLLIADAEFDVDMKVVRGKVVAHSPRRDDIYQQLLMLKEKSVAIEYTGEPPVDLAVLL